MQNDVDRKTTALVTGGSRGIGRAVAVALAEAGVNHIFVGYLQRESEAAETVRQIEANGVSATAVAANLGYPQEIEKLFETVATVSSRLDYFVHCAALGAFKPLIDVKANQWDISLDTNARSFLLCVQQCLKLMPAGRIVALSSLGARRAMANYGAIGPSKAALEAVIRQLATELAPRGIGVNGVSAGPVETESLAALPGWEQLRTDVVSRTPAGRIGRAADIASVVLFLLGKESGWITGQTIVADGGLSLF